jgi:hypothetical protein
MSLWVLTTETLRGGGWNAENVHMAYTDAKGGFSIMDGINAERDYGNYLAALGLQALGLDRLNALIKDGQTSGAVDRTTATRMRQLIRELEKDGRIANAEPLTAEIDEKVRAVARFAR